MGNWQRAIACSSSPVAWLRQGIPEQIARESRYTSRVVLPELNDLTRETVTVNETDYLILDPAPAVP